MSTWPAVIFVIAVLIDLFGFGGMAGTAKSAVPLAKVCYFILLTLSVIGFVFARRSEGR